VSFYERDMGRLLASQLELQQRSFSTDPRTLRGDARADYAEWNAFALEDEIHEAMQELKWKPWLTTGRGDWVNRDAFVQELVDAFHFFMNLLLLAGVVDGVWTPQQLADEFTARYIEKREVNVRRQAEGYDGSKDGDGRALDEPS
jgi:hypothetical protein